LDGESAESEGAEVLLLQTHLERRMKIPSQEANLSNVASRVADLLAMDEGVHQPKEPVPTKTPPKNLAGISLRPHESWPSARVLVIEILLVCLYVFRGTVKQILQRMQDSSFTQRDLASAGASQLLAANENNLPASLPGSGREDPLEQRLLHWRVSRIANLEPSRIALREAHVQESFGKLHASALYVAKYLIEERGVKPSSRTVIGVCAEGTRMMHAIYGIVYTGNPYLALPHTLSISSREFILRDAKIQVVLGQSSLISPESPPETKRMISSPDHVLENALTEDWMPSWKVSERDLAYVVYTPGSTGKPKGVLAAHRTHYSRLAWMWSTYPLAEGEVGIQKTAISCVDHVQEVFGFLGDGAPLVLTPTKARTNPLQLISLCRQHDVSRLVLVPSLLRVMVESCGNNLANELPSLRFWIVSGEPFPTALLRAALKAAAPGSTFLNTYGTTEIAGDISWAAYNSSSALPNIGVVPVGRAIPPNTIHILDPCTLQQVPPGEPGEIFVEGPQLAVGYHIRPEEEEIRFVKLPHLGIERAFRTGDFGKLGANNMMEFLGTMDQQVKVQGRLVNIPQVELELGKAVSSCMAHGKEKNAIVSFTCAVVAVPSKGSKHNVGSYNLLAFIEMASTEERGSDIHESMQLMLRQEMLRALAPASVPGLFIGVNKLPKLASGKLDRVALRQMAMTRDGPEQQQQGHVLEEIDSFGQVRQILGEHENGRRLLGTMNTCALGLAIMAHWTVLDPVVLGPHRVHLPQSVLTMTGSFLWMRQIDVSLLVAGAGGLHAMGGETRFNISWEPIFFVVTGLIYFLVGLSGSSTKYLYILPQIFCARVWALLWHKIVRICGAVDTYVTDMLSIALSVGILLFLSALLQVFCTFLGCYLFGFYFAPTIIGRAAQSRSSCKFGFRFVLSASLLAVSIVILQEDQIFTTQYFKRECFLLPAVAGGLGLFSLLPKGIDLSLHGTSQLLAYVLFCPVQPWVFAGVKIFNVRLFPSLLDMLSVVGKAVFPVNGVLQAIVCYAYVSAYLVIIAEIARLPNAWLMKLHGRPHMS